MEEKLVSNERNIVVNTEENNKAKDNRNVKTISNLFEDKEIRSVWDSERYGK